MPSLRKRKKRLLLWTRWWAHYHWNEDFKVTPACNRARRAVYEQPSYGHAWDGSDNPYAGPYGDLVRADMERLGLY